MSEPSLRKRIWGWFFFDWASQPYFTVLLTFIFGPYFASVAATHFMDVGLDELAADARAQSLWAWLLTITGLIVAFSAPIMGAMADTASRRMPWIAVFSLMVFVGAFALWWVFPDGSNLTWALVFFGLGFIGAEYALIFTNAQLPSLGTKEEIGQISGSGFAFGYAGGLVALILLLALFVEQANGKTIAGLAPILGLDPEAREGTRSAGPFVAIWYAIFMVPYFLWVREVRVELRRTSVGIVFQSMIQVIPGPTCCDDDQLVRR